MTLNELLLQAAASFDSDSARLDAELLLSEVLDCQRSYFYTWPDKVLDGESVARFECLAERRRRGEPVAHILGRRDFWTLELDVTADTLIPRPDTELLVETALERLPKGEQTIVDLGTGSGAIALALASERPQWQVYALDRYAGAVSLAQRNRRKHQLDRVHIVQGDWADSLASGCFDLVISNPPYIEEHDAHLSDGDVRFEPLTALVAPQQGLADIERITQQAASLLKAGGYLMLEHGFQQGGAVRAILQAAGFVALQTHQDLAGLDRISLGCWPEQDEGDQ
jgi:release factor glutamine methyltransferase